MHVNALQHAVGGDGSKGAVKPGSASWAIAVSASHCFGPGTVVEDVLQQHLVACLRVALRAIVIGNGPLLDVFCTSSDATRNEETRTRDRHAMACELVAVANAVPSGATLRHRWQRGQSEFSASSRRRALVAAPSSSGFTHDGDGGVRLLFCAIRLTADVVATPADLSLSALGGSSEGASAPATATAGVAHSHQHDETASPGRRPTDAVQTIAAQALRVSTRSARSPIVDLLLRLSGGVSGNSEPAQQRTAKEVEAPCCFEVLSVKVVPGPLSAVADAELKRGATRVGVEYGGVRAPTDVISGVRANSAVVDSPTLVLLLKTAGNSGDAADLLGLLQTFRAAAHHAWAHGSPDGALSPLSV